MVKTVNLFVTSSMLVNNFHLLDTDMQKVHFYLVL